LETIALQVLQLSARSGMVWHTGTSAAAPKAYHHFLSKTVTK